MRVPVYAASVGLFAVYAWGYLNADLCGLAWGLGVTAVSELLKPQLGELAARALEAGDPTARHVISAAAIVCVLLGAAGGVTAMHVVDAPRAIRRRRAGGGGSAQCGACPPARQTCPPRAVTAPILLERRARLAAAHANVAEAREALSAAHTISG